MVIFFIVYQLYKKWTRHPRHAVLILLAGRPRGDAPGEGRGGYKSKEKTGWARGDSALRRNFQGDIIYRNLFFCLSMNAMQHQEK